jgi:hypothetical protein
VFCIWQKADQPAATTKQAWWLRKHWRFKAKRQRALLQNLNLASSKTKLEHSKKKVKKLQTQKKFQPRFSPTSVNPKRVILVPLCLTFCVRTGTR